MESIGDAQGFSVETLTGVTLQWKTEYLDDCSTTIRYVARKVATVEGRLVCFGGDTIVGM